MWKRTIAAVLVVCTAAAAGAKPPRVLTQEETQLAYTASCRRILEMLVALATAQFAPIEEVKFSPAMRDSIDVRLWADSQNRMGAYLRTRFTCRVWRGRGDRLMVNCRKGIFER